MNPGDRVICVDMRDHCWFLHFGREYTVDTVSGLMISLVGFARMWPADQFKLAEQKK